MPEAGYTDADNEVVIYLDQNDNCEKIISMGKMGVTADNRYSRIFNSVEYWNRFLDSCYSYCENKYCWQFKIFWKWYDRFIQK